jgi:hypothetical protein
MHINEILSPANHPLFEFYNQTNDTGYSTEDLMKIMNQRKSGSWRIENNEVDEAKGKMVKKKPMDRTSASASSQPTIKPDPVIFLTCDLYNETYEMKIKRGAKSLKNKLEVWKEAKTQNPRTPFNKYEKPFIATGPYGPTTAHPNIFREHNMGDNLRLVFEVVANRIYMYGFFTHSDLGTGDASNIVRQGQMATQFRGAKFPEPTTPPPSRPVYEGKKRT